ncbi:MAG TPA: DUF1080 domain-containing protein [Balneolaceae bacterium]|nr:DUF1080 domain-containing protein [Balneolaceae bacterium]
MENRFVQRESIHNKSFCLVFGLMLLILGGCQKSKTTSQLPKITKNKFTKIFNGKNLNGWKYDPTYWSVKNGNLVGTITPSTIVKHNTFIIWQGHVPSNFVLKVEYRITKNGNSGINYRSQMVKGVPYALKGYQADIAGAARYGPEKRVTGSNYEERRRTTLASIGQKVVLPSIPNADSLQAHIKNNHWTASIIKGSLGNRDSLEDHINFNGWNKYRIVVKGNHLKHYLNGVLMSDVTDNDTTNRRFNGYVGVQVHVGPPMKVKFRNFRIKKLPGSNN